MLFPDLDLDNREKATRRARTPASDTCRLAITIRDIPYSLRPAENDANHPMRAWTLRKLDGTHYTVAETPDGATCDCADWVMRREHLDPRGCKHIRALRVFGLVSETEIRLERYHSCD